MNYLNYNTVVFLFYSTHIHRDNSFKLEIMCKDIVHVKFMFSNMTRIIIFLNHNIFIHYHRFNQ